MTVESAERTPPSTGRHFKQPRTGPTPRWLAGFAALMVVAVAASAALTYVGVKTVRASRAGKSVSTVTDPAEPGFEAFLEPTPTLLVLHSVGSTLVSAAVLSLDSGEAGGSVLLVPPDTRLSDDPAAFTLAAVAAFGGSTEAAVPGLQDLLGVGIAEVVVVDDARWGELLAPVAPLALVNPDAVGVFPGGPISLAPDAVGPYLTAHNEGESDLARLYRQQVFFEAWVAAVAASPNPGAVPGEGSAGLGRFISALATGPLRVATLPVIESPTPTGSRLDLDPDVAQTLLDELVPFPTAPHPGGRVRVRLLDGAGDPEHVSQVAPLVVPARSEIVVVGNADRFDYQATEVRYHDPVLKAAAERLRAALGAGRVVADPRPTDSFDVTIILGTDL